MVSAAGIAPAIPRSQAERVAATLRAVGSGVAVDAGAGETRDPQPWKRSRGKIVKLADPKGVAPSTLPQTTGRSAG